MQLPVGVPVRYGKPEPWKGVAAKIGRTKPSRARSSLSLHQRRKRNDGRPPDTRQALTSARKRRETVLKKIAQRLRTSSKGLPADVHPLKLSRFPSVPHTLALARDASVATDASTDSGSTSQEPEHLPKQQDARPMKDMVLPKSKLRPLERYDLEACIHCPSNRAIC